MVSVSDNKVDRQPSRGFVGAQRILSGHQGANAALQLFGRGKYLLGGWCGPQSAVELWQVEPSRVLQSITLEMQLADMAAGIEQPMVIPPGVSTDRSDWAPHLVPVMDASVCASGARIVVAGGRGVRILELDGQQVQWRRRDVFRGHGATLTACAVNTDGEIAASADQSGGVIVWGTESVRELHRLRITTVPQCLSFIWQDHLLAAGDDRGRVICWEVAQGRRHLQFQAHHGAVNSLHFDTTTGCLVTTGADGCARIWNLERGAQVGVDLTHNGPVHSAIVVNGGRFVLTGGADGRVGVWSAHDGLLLDWYNDGAPVFGLSAADAVDTVVVSGARSVKVLHLDWLRLRELALSASRMSQARQSQEALGYAFPPATAAVNYSGVSNQAPVGSVMAARQTSDLPLPEQSAARIDRSQSAALRAAAGQPLGSDTRFGPPATQALSAITGPASGTAASLGAHSGGFSGGLPYADASAGGRTAASSLSPPFEPPAASSGTSSSFANGFFEEDDLSPSSNPAASQLPFHVSSHATSQASRRPVTPLTTSPVPSRGTLEAPDRQSLSTDAAIVVPGSYTGRAIDEDILEGAPRPKPPEIVVPARFPIVAAAFVMVSALLGGFITFAVSDRYYSSTGIPDGLQNRPMEIETSFTNAMNTAQATFDEVRVQQEALMNDEAADPALLPSQVDRLRVMHERQIENARETMNEARLEAARQRDERVEALQPEREELAFNTGIRHGSYVGVLLLLLGLVVIQVLEKRKRAAVPAHRRTR